MSSESGSKHSTLDQNGSQDEVKYTVVAPGLLIAHSQYKVLATISQSPVPVNFDLELSGTSPSETDIVCTKSKILRSDESWEVVFDIGDWKPGQYKLRAKGYTTQESGDESEANKKRVLFNDEVLRGTLKLGSQTQLNC